MKGIIGVILVFIGISCTYTNDSVAEYYEDNSLKSITYFEHKEPKYKRVETYDRKGNLVSNEEFLNDTLNGYSWVTLNYNNEPMIVETTFRNGIKHGVVRCIWLQKKKSAEYLFINGQCRFGKESIVHNFIKSNSDTLKGFAYMSGRVEDDKIKEFQRILYLKDTIYKNVNDIDYDDIDIGMSNFYSDNLSDTLELGINIDFSLDVSHLCSDTLDYIGSEFAYYNNQRKNKNEVYMFDSEGGSKKINCKILSDNKGPACIIGAIKITCREPGSSDTIYYDHDYYKQVYFR